MEVPPLERAFRPTTPEEVLAAYRQATISRSAAALRETYAPGAVHEFPFTRAGVPSRIEGRDEIIAFIQGGWDVSPLHYQSYRTLAEHRPDARTLIVEQEVIGTNTATGTPFVLANLAILVVDDGQIIHLRDYVNVLAVAAALRPGSAN